MIGYPASAAENKEDKERGKNESDSAMSWGI